MLVLWNAGHLATTIYILQMVTIVSKESHLIRHVHTCTWDFNVDLHMTAAHASRALSVCNAGARNEWRNWMRREMVSTVEEQASPEVSRKVCTSKSRNVCSVEWRYVWTWNDGWNWMGTRWRSYKILAVGSHDATVAGSWFKIYESGGNERSQSDTTTSAIK